MQHQHRSHLMLLLLALVALPGQQLAKAYTQAKDNSRQNHYGTRQHRARPQANLLVVVIGG